MTDTQQRFSLRHSVAADIACSVGVVQGLTIRAGPKTAVIVVARGGGGGRVAVAVAAIKGRAERLSSFGRHDCGVTDQDSQLAVVTSSGCFSRLLLLLMSAINCVKHENEGDSSCAAPWLLLERNL